MATKIKGIYKSFKFISQIFVVKEREMEIGYPTDVKHVAHIGWDGPCGNAPSWMNEFKTPEFSTSLVDMGEIRDPSSMGISTSSSIDFELSVDHQQSDIFRDVPPKEHRHDAKKHKWKKTRSTSSPKSSASTTRSSRSAKSKVALHIMEGKQHQAC